MKKLLLKSIGLAFVGLTMGTMQASAYSYTVYFTGEFADGVKSFKVNNNGTGMTEQEVLASQVITVDETLSNTNSYVGVELNEGYVFDGLPYAMRSGAKEDFTLSNIQTVSSQMISNKNKDNSDLSVYIPVRVQKSEKTVIKIYVEDLNILGLFATPQPAGTNFKSQLVQGSNQIEIEDGYYAFRMNKQKNYAGYWYVNGQYFGGAAAGVNSGNLDIPITSSEMNIEVVSEIRTQSDPVISVNLSDPKLAECITFSCANAIIEDGKTWADGFTATAGSTMSLQIKEVEGTNYLLANVTNLNVNGVPMPVSKYLLSNYTIADDTEIVIDGFKYEPYDFTINCPYPAAVDAYLQEKVTSDDSALLTAVTSPTGNTYAAGSKLPVTLMTIPSGENTYHVGDHEYWGAFVNKIMVEPLSGYYIEEISSTAGEVTKSNSTVVAYFVPVAPNCTVTLNLQPIVRDKTLKINVVGVITSNGWSVTSDGKSTDVNARKLEGVTLELADNSDPITLHTGLNTISYGRGDSPMRLIFTGAFEGVAELTDSNSGDVIAPNDQRGSVWFIDADALAEEVNEGENVELDFVSKFSTTPKVNVSYSSNFMNVKPLIVKTSSVFDYYRIPLNDNRPSDEEIKENQVAYDNIVYANSQCLPMGVESINLNSNAGEYLIIHKIYGMDLTSVMFNNEEMVNSFITDEVSILLFPWQADNNLEIMGDDNLVATGIDAVLNGENATADVYNLQGVCVRRAADKQNINDLPKGLYIIDGRKVIVK